MLLSNVLKDLLEHINTLCSLCLKKIDTKDYKPIQIDDEIYIGECDEHELNTILMSDMISYLFPDKSLASTSICRDCVRSTIQAFTFIETCTQADRKLTNLIDTLSTSLDNMDNKKKSKTTLCRVFIKTSEDDKKSTIYYDREKKFLIKNKYMRFKKLSKPSMICDACGVTCTTKHSLKRHLRESCKVMSLLNIKKSEIEDQKICETNDQYDSTQALLKEHRKNKSSICSICGKRVNHLKDHMEVHNDPKLRCRNCGKKYRSKWSYEYHVNNETCVKKTDIKGPTNHECYECGAKYKRWFALVSHMRIHSENSADYYECDWCKKKFGWKTSLKDHIVKHTKEKKWTCEFCGGNFVSKASLICHTRTHTGEKPFKCANCDKAFLSASRLKIHERMKHLPPQLQCPFCDKKFKIHSQLTRHRIRHFMPKSSLYLGKDKAELLKDQCYIRPPEKLKPGLELTFK